MNIALADGRITRAEIDALRTKFMAEQFKIDVWLRNNCDKVTRDARAELDILGTVCSLPKNEILNPNIESSKQAVVTMLEKKWIRWVEFNTVRNDNDKINSNIFQIGNEFYILYVSKIHGWLSMKRMNGLKSVFLDSNGVWKKENDSPGVSISVIQSAIDKLKL